MEEDQAPRLPSGEYQYRFDGTPPPPPNATPDDYFFTKPRVYETPRGRVALLSVAGVFIIVLALALYSCGLPHGKPIVLATPTSTAYSASTATNAPISTYPATSTYPPTSTTQPGHAAPTPWPTHTPFPTYTPYPRQPTPTMYPGQPTYTPLPVPPSATPIPPTATAIPISTLDDTLVDFSHTSAHDSDLALAGGGGVMQGDNDIVYRQSITNDTLTWHFTNTLRAVFTCYFQPSEVLPTHQAFAVSQDGSGFSAISAIIAGPFVGVGGQWTKYVYTVIPGGANYVQMIWQSQVANGSPECGEADFTYQS